MMGLKRKIKQAFWKNRGMGMVPNEPDGRDYKYVKANKSVALYDGGEISLEHYSDVVDQGSTNSCVGQAVAGAVWIMERQSRHEYGYPSRQWLYWNARYRHQGVNVTDDGTYIRACCKALFKIGVPDEEYCPFSRRRINSRPEFGMFAHADPRKNGQYHFIKETGKDRVDVIKSALTEGKPVVFGTSLVDSFMPAKGDFVIERPWSDEETVGRHAMVIVGMRKVDGKNQFRILNSWGKHWRDGGKCWFTEDYITWRKTRDLTVVSGWKRLQK